MLILTPEGTISVFDICMEWALGELGAPYGAEGEDPAEFCRTALYPPDE